MKEFPRKFLSLRDKNGANRRPRAAQQTPAVSAVTENGTKNKPRPLSTGAFMSMFKTDGNKQANKAGEEKENEQARVDEVLRQLDELNITNVTIDHIHDIMATKYADGDPKKTAEFIDMEQKASAGIILPYDPSVHMVGAENRYNVTCYLDALLFAMFAKLSAFECMLKNDFPEEDSRNRLVTLLRMWVNMLRTGKLVHTDFTKLIQDALADSGWSDARMLEQQDTSEAFAFITETLQLPLLSLQVDLFHQGKKDKDDHKVVYERLLNLAVPPDPEDKGIKLEDCLEEYFNAQVDVKRDSEDGKKLTFEDMSHVDTPKLTHRDTIRLITEEQGESSTPVTPIVSSPIAISPLQSTPTVEKPHIDIPKSDVKSEKNEASDGEHIGEVTHVELPPQKPTIRGRSTSVIQRIVLDEQGRPSTPTNVTMLQKAMRRGSTVVKAVTIPAWQFFRLIPWHALSSSEPRNNTEVAMNFDQRPVVGICLKRYAMTESGQPKRHNTFIDIPDSLRLPRFMLADDPKTDDEPNALSTEYKLVLQSVVCHRGDSLQSGHYIAFARVAPKLLRDNRRHDFDPPPDYEEAQWVRFDDLDPESRVTYVDDIKKSLKEEMPYLLFYQVVPMVEVTASSVDGGETEPPSYNDSKVSVELPPTPARIDGSQLDVSGQEGSYFDNASTVEPLGPSPSKPPSIRLSSDSERPPRKSGEGSEFGLGSFLSSSRRPSVIWTESTVTSPNHSPSITPNEESTASRLSRAASRFAKANRSRPSSQSGDNRISFSMSRLGGLMRPSKEVLNDSSTVGMSSVNSTGLLTQETPRESLEENAPPAAQELEVSAQPQQQQQHHHHHHGHKHGHKRIRSKDKIKTKDGSQPERECTVM